MFFMGFIQYWLAYLFNLGTYVITCHMLKETCDYTATECYSHVGCFSSGPPSFDPLRPLSTFPEYNMQIKFFLYTTPSSKYRLYLSESSVSGSPFDREMETKIMIHGFETEVRANNWMFRLRDQLFKNGNYNIIVVDWSGSNTFPYYQAVANCRKVGADTAYLLSLIQKQKNISFGSVHVIGHSLGAHAAGIAGKRVEKLGRISGLDPAGPGFWEAPPEIRLSRGDALFVDVIHTNGGEGYLQGFGLYQNIGSQDFYVNGGMTQPCCENNTCSFDGSDETQNIFTQSKPKSTSTENKNSFFGGLFQDIMDFMPDMILDIMDFMPDVSLGITVNPCDHSASQDYYIYSVNNCTFYGIMCENYDDFQAGKCTKGNSVVEAVMGFHARPIPDSDIKKGDEFYLNTGDYPPLCLPNPVSAN